MKIIEIATLKIITVITVIFERKKRDCLFTQRIHSSKYADQTAPKGAVWSGSAVFLRPMCYFQVDSITIQDPHNFQMKQWTNPAVRNGKVYLQICFLHVYGHL